MTKPSFIFVRHGQSLANANTIIADRQSPLTEMGIEQARKTAEEIRDLGITRIVCSPFLRAQQTAETIAGELGIDLAHIQIIDDLRERYQGSLENNPREHEGIWYFTDDTSEGIEPRTELLARMIQCASTLKELAQAETLLVVGHAISGFYLAQAVAGKTSLDQLDPVNLMNNADYVELSYTS
jgi:broad specificity phosphatase PhoE